MVEGREGGKEEVRNGGGKGWRVKQHHSSVDYRLCQGKVVARLNTWLVFLKLCFLQLAGQKKDTGTGGVVFYSSW